MCGSDTGLCLIAGCGTGNVKPSGITLECYLFNHYLLPGWIFL
jgi:hypothetical protein